MTESSMGDEVYQPDGSEVQDDAGLLDAEDTLEDPSLQILSDGYSPPERPWAVERWAPPRWSSTAARASTSGWPRKRRTSPSLRATGWGTPGTRTAS